MVLVVDERMIETFQLKMYADFEQQCLDFLHEHFPEFAITADRVCEFDSVRTGIQCSVQSGFITEVEIAKFLYLRQLLGHGFEHSPGASQVLADARLDPEARLNRVLDLAGAALASHLSGSST